VIVEQLLGSLIGTTLGLRGKRHGRARSFLTGGPSSFLNTSTLLTAAGLAATAYTLYRAHQTATPMSTSLVSGGPLPPGLPPLVPPRVPSAPVSTTTVLSAATSAPPPIPVTAPASIAASAAAPGAAAAAPVDALTRIVALSIAAARCDGELGEDEYGRVLEVARENRAESLVGRELSHARPLAELAAGVTDAQHKADLYVLAYSILRADEQVSSAERKWLAQWADLLRLDPASTARLEKDAAYRIASAPVGNGA
jgi:uncharacterized membrane protein YebE (DUF533 family)